MTKPIIEHARYLIAHAEGLNEKREAVLKVLWQKNREFIKIQRAKIKRSRERLKILKRQLMEKEMREKYGG